MLLTTMQKIKHEHSGRPQNIRTLENVNNIIIIITILLIYFLCNKSLFCTPRYFN
jgi:hypothetical protein